MKVNRAVRILASLLDGEQRIDATVKEMHILQSFALIIMIPKSALEAYRKTAKKGAAIWAALGVSLRKQRSAEEIRARRQKESGSRWRMKRQKEEAEREAELMTEFLDMMARKDQFGKTLIDSFFPDMNQSFLGDDWTPVGEGLMVHVTQRGKNLCYADLTGECSIFFPNQNKEDILLHAAMAKAEEKTDQFFQW